MVAPVHTVGKSLMAKDSLFFLSWNVPSKCIGCQRKRPWQGHTVAMMYKHSIEAFYVKKNATLQKGPYNICIYICPCLSCIFYTSPWIVHSKLHLLNGIIMLDGKWLQLRKRVNGLVQFAKTCENGTVALSFLFDKHCPIIE
jgi:hypothetical protein